MTYPRICLLDGCTNISQLYSCFCLPEHALQWLMDHPALLSAADRRAIREASAHTPERVTGTGAR